MLSSTDRPARKPTCSGGSSPRFSTMCDSLARIMRSNSLLVLLVSAIGL